MVHLIKNILIQLSNENQLRHQYFCMYVNEFLLSFFIEILDDLVTDRQATPDYWEHSSKTVMEPIFKALGDPSTTLQVFQKNSLYKQTNSQTDKQTNGQINKQTNKQTDKETNRQRNKQTKKQTDKETNRQ